MDRIVVVLAVVAAIGSGLMGGFFFAFSNTVMGALGRLPPAQGIAAMQAINVVVLNPLFFLAFFGTAALCLLLAGAGFWWGPLNPWLLLAAGLTYLIGCLGVTMVCNVPLNNELAAVQPDSAGAAALWSRYLETWTAWNHARTAACVAAMAAFTIGLLES